MVRSSPPLLAATTALAALAAPSFVTAAELPETVTALIDDSVDPCEDFYQYACGAWIDSTTIPEDEQAWAYSFSTIKDNIDTVLKDVLSNGDKPIVGDLWKSCMDLDSINALGSDPLQDALQRIAAAETNEELFELAGEFSRVGSSFITALSVNANPSDATVNQLSASYAPLTIEVQYYADDALLDQYAQTMVDYAAAILDLSGWFDLLDNSGSISYPTDESESASGGNYALDVKDDSSDSSSTDESTHKNHLHLRIHHSDDRRRLGESGNEPINASVVLDFEYSLVSIMLLSDDVPEGELYLPVTLKDAVELYPLSIGSFLTGMDLYEDATSLTNDSVLAFWSQKYYEEVEKFVSELDLPTLKTYLAYTYINSQVSYLGEDFLDASFELFQRALVGQEVKSERDEICISKLIKLVPDQVGLYYYEAQFGPDQEKLAEDLVDHLKAAMKTHIDDVEWLDDETTKQAQDKLSKIVDLIGHSKEESMLDVTLDPTTFFANAQAINDAKARDYASEAYNPVDRSKWLLSAATVNAYYTPLANQIVFPAGILQPPMFNASAHPAQNYGSIGMVIGHEITHGFDSSGREYDGNGNHVDWWSEKTSAAFDERTDCFIEQYNAYAVPGENGSTIGYVNGNLTVTENIADNGGIRVAYDAFVDYLDSGDAVIPDGVTDYDDDDADKLFFLAFAQTWCEKDRDASLVQQITTNEHSPTRWRVNGAVSNSDAFSKVFNCPATATLNPTNKCVIW